MRDSWSREVTHTLVNARRIKMPGTRAAEQHQWRRRDAELLEIRTLDRWTRVRVQQIPTRRGQKTTSVTDDENLADRMDVAAKTKMVICDPSYANPSKTKVIGKVVRYTNILEALIPDLLNEDGKLIDTGQIIIAQKPQERKNDIYVMLVS